MTLIEKSLYLKYFLLRQFKEEKEGGREEKVKLKGENYEAIYMKTHDCYPINQNGQ